MGALQRKPGGPCRAARMRKCHASGRGGGKGRGRNGKGAGIRKKEKGRVESWNRAAEWLRPALDLWLEVI